MQVVDVTPALCANFSEASYSWTCLSAVFGNATSGEQVTYRLAAGVWTLGGQVFVPSGATLTTATVPVPEGGTSGSPVLSTACGFAFRRPSVGLFVETLDPHTTS